MDYEIAKGKPLTKEESKFLLDLIEASKIITTKTTNASNNKLKNEEWVQLTERFNASATSGRRTPQQLRLKWENLKKNSRKRCTKIRMNLIKTGGGPAEYIPPDDILDRVTGMLGSTASGFTVPFGGDREKVGLDVGVLMGGEGGKSGDGDATVAVELTEVVDFMPMSTDHGIQIVVCDGEGEGEGVGVGVGEGGGVVKKNAYPNVTPNRPKRFTLGTPRTVRKKLKQDDSRTARNDSIAEYFSAKKQCLDAKLNNIFLENENFKLKNAQLSLEIEKLKLELEKLRK